MAAGGREEEGGGGPRREEERRGMEKSSKAGRVIKTGLERVGRLDILKKKKKNINHKGRQSASMSTRKKSEGRGKKDSPPRPLPSMPHPWTSTHRHTHTLPSRRPSRHPCALSSPTRMRPSSYVPSNPTARRACPPCRNEDGWDHLFC